MARKYEHIQNYEKEIKEMLDEGRSQREIGEALGFSREQVHGFVKRLHAKERRKAAGEVPKKKGRATKEGKYSGTDKEGELKYQLAQKEARIKQLEMENELMRDFLSLTGRK